MGTTRRTFVPLVLALAGAALLGAAGCSLFHRETRQQQFIEAVERGNAPQASTLWLHMSPEDRMAFQHGQGMSPQTSPAEIKREVMQKAEAQATDQSGAAAGPGLDPNEGLLDLPNYAPAPSTPLYKATTPPAD